MDKITVIGAGLAGCEAAMQIANAGVLVDLLEMKPIKKTESSIEVDPFVDDGYDGYYDDVRPVDEGHEREGNDKELIKKIAIIIGVLFVVIAACVALMYVL